MSDPQPPDAVAGLVPALAHAVTGRRLEPTSPGQQGVGDEVVGPGGSGVVAQVLALLTAAGVTADEVAAEAVRRRRQELPWPHPVPTGWLQPGTHARYQAALQELLAALVPRRPVVAGPGARPGPRDRELDADRPPHW